MEIKDLLKKFKESNIDISLNGSNLQLHSDSPEIPQPLIEEIKKNKEAIISYLKMNIVTADDHSPIPAVAPAASYEMSSSQRRLWILSQFEEGEGAYNMFKVHVFEGDLDKNALERAMKRMVERHEILRTVFKEDSAGEIRQYVNTIADVNCDIDYIDLRSEKEKDDQAKKLIEAAIHKPFDIFAGPLFNASLIHLTDSKWIFAYTLHHIISDGWSMRIMLKELLTLYNNFIKNAPDPLKPLRIQYKDYAAWQQAQLKGEQLQLHKEYWRRQFEGELPVLDLPVDTIRPAVKTFNGKKVSKTVSREILEKIKALNQEQGTTLFMSLLASVNVLLYRYTGQDDIIIGSPIAGRSHADLEEQIGFYVNTLALRTHVDGAKNFRQLLSDTKQLTLGAFEHQVYPFDELVDELQINRDMSRNVLFDVMVVLQNTQVVAKIEEERLGNMVVRAYAEEEHVVSKFDLTFDLTEYGDGLDITIEYNSDLFENATIVRMCDHFGRLLDAIGKAPDKELNALDYLSGAEKKRLLEELNVTAVDFPEKTIVDLFNEQVIKNPGNAALVFEGRTLTYAELDTLSLRFAAYLKQHFMLTANQLVAVRLQRSDWAIVAVLAILRSGNAYLPIDPEYPQERIEFMLEDSKCQVIIDEDILNAFKSREASSPDRPELKADPQSLAYVIYTSGSTGKPKGVMITHGAIANTVLSQQLIFDLTGNERGLQFASMSFDASVWEIFAMLCFGGCVYIIDEASKKDPALFEEYILNNRVTFATLPPAYLKLLRIPELKSIKTLITAGEPAVPADVEKFLPVGKYYNAYGPTESSICATVQEVKKENQDTAKNIPIGKPIPNTRICILDKNLQLLPYGLTGEICISGKGLANGYLNNQQLTEEKFVKHPFFPGELMYRTGDYGKWLPVGNLEFTGRKDNQIKVRGYRIELQEIEKNILSYADTTAAVVLVKQSEDGEKSLVAYVSGSAGLDLSALKEYLRKTLPAYMLPDHFVKKDSFRLTSNGKIDKKALENDSDAPAHAAVDYVPPGNKTEEQLVAVYSEILGRKKEEISILDNFFDLGGNSLKIIRINKKINVLLNRKDPVSILFIYPSIREYANYITNNAESNQLSDELINTAVDDLENSMLAFNELNNEDDE